MKTDLLTYVRSQLERDAVHVPVVSKATGISVQWLYQLRSGKIPNPGVRQIQKLAEYFGRQG